MVSATGIVVGFIAVVVAAYAVTTYNSLVMLRRNIDKAWSNIDVLLKQRHDEIPKLVDVAQEYADYEQSVLEDLTEKREQAEKAEGAGEKIQAEKKLGAALGNFFARAEDYPDLKANKNFMQLQERISKLEDQIADRREFYNSSVNTFNIRIHQIPYNIFASMMNYTEKDLFEVSEEERADVDVGEMFDEE